MAEDRDGTRWRAIEFTSMTPVGLYAPRRDEVQAVRGWRVSARPGLRTLRMLTENDQDRFYETVICDPDSPHRYYSVREEASGALVAFGGLTYLSWANGHTEISLIVDPARQGEGFGGAAVYHLLEEAFDRMRMLTVFGEVYHTNPAAVLFWKRMLEAHDGPTGSVEIPGRKFWHGEAYPATLFWMQRP